MPLVHLLVLILFNGEIEARTLVDPRLLQGNESAAPSPAIVVTGVPTSSNDTALTDSPSASNGTQAPVVSVPTVSPSPTVRVSMQPTTSTLPSYESARPSASWYPTITVQPTGSLYPTITDIPTVAPTQSDPTSSPTSSPVRDEIPSTPQPSVLQPIDSSPRPTARPNPRPTPRPTFKPRDPPDNGPAGEASDDGFESGATVGIVILVVAVFFFCSVYLCRRRKYSYRRQQGGSGNDFEMTPSYHDGDGWQNETPLTAEEMGDDDGLI